MKTFLALLFLTGCGIEAADVTAAAQDVSVFYQPSYQLCGVQQQDFLPVSEQLPELDREQCGLVYTTHVTRGRYLMIDGDDACRAPEETCLVVRPGQTVVILAGRSYDPWKGSLAWAPAPCDISCAEFMQSEARRYE